VENAGKKWFSDSSIQDQVRLKSGDAIDSKKLLQDANWLNRNPFRQVDVYLKQGEQVGETDVSLHVEDRFPVRFYAGYEDSGTQLTGKDRLLTGFNWGNVFGVGHQFNYQYTTDTSLSYLKAHSAAYVIPLPWRHTFSLYGSYVTGKANFPSSMAGFNQDIESWQGSGRYEIPLLPIDVPWLSNGQFTHQLSVGFDFKRSNNGLEFGQTSLSTSTTDIGQFEVGYSFSVPDPIGQTKLGLELFYSPGNLFDRNTDTDFSLLRTGARSEYMYYRATLERLTKLPCNFSWLLNMSAQGANERLLPSEELGLGGWQTVRGYDERVINGDQGVFASTELRTPPINLISPMVDWVSEGDDKPKSSDKKPFWRNDQFQFLVFFDAGATRLKKTQPGELDHQWLASYGAGFRYNINPYLAVRFDYGFQLHDSRASTVSPGLDFTKHSRGHLGVLVSF
jgi:hemolysin activation/secretion protein